MEEFLLKNWQFIFSGIGSCVLGITTTAIYFLKQELRQNNRITVNETDISDHEIRLSELEKKDEKIIAFMARVDAKLENIDESMKYIKNKILN